MRTYTELMGLSSFEERFRYLKLSKSSGMALEGHPRFVSQGFYHSAEWRNVRDFVIVRDLGCDLACPDRPIYGVIKVHHMNPISLEDIEKGSDLVLNPEFLITTCQRTHNSIHYGDESLIFSQHFVERRPNDTIPWKN